MLSLSLAQTSERAILIQKIKFADKKIPLMDKGTKIIMRKILIVEDDEKLCRELGTFLTNNGYQAESLPEGEYTVKAILEAQPDLVLLDLGLPGTDGLYLCRELRKVCELPVIVITSQDTRW